MKIIERIKDKQADWQGNRQPVIAFLGDSVTHGCFEVFVCNESIKTKVEMSQGYHSKVKEIFSMIYPEVPITIINAGISGDSAKNGIKRLQRDVLSYEPDIVVVCYGLNDATECNNGLTEYINALNKIFSDIVNSGAEAIFLTPNLRTNKLEIKFCEDKLNRCAEEIALNENEGWLEKYLEEARKLCKEKQIPVCDCNKIWQLLKDNNVNINRLLSNRINHPTEKMHWLFAYELVKTMFTN